MPGSPSSEPSGAAGAIDLVAVGAELRRIRDELGLSQAAMAAELNLQGYSPGGRKVSTPRATISAFERGRRPAPAPVLAEYERRSTQPQRLRDLLDPPPQASSPADGTDSAPSGEPAAEGLDADHESTPGPDALPVKDRRDGPDELSVNERGVPAGGSVRDRPTRWRRRAVVGGAAAAVVLMAAGVVVGVGLSDHGERAGQVPPPTWTETTGGSAHTWSDAAQAAGRAGPPLGPRQSVQVSCRVRGFVVQDGDPWWYRIESPPWNGDYYATSDAFYNNGDVDGPFINGIVVDEQVPLC